MAGPFPGMDPWLENPYLWQGVQNRFITYLADALTPIIRPRYVAAVDARVYVSGTGRKIVPDLMLQKRRDKPFQSSSTVVAIEPDEALVVEAVQDEIHEAFIEVIDLEHKQEIVTVIEIISHDNKLRGEGRELYTEKQREILHSPANLVEIDLLRGGPHVVAASESDVLRWGPYDYLVAINRAWDRNMRTLLYPRTVRDPLPKIPIPLREEDGAATIDLQRLMDHLYDAGAFDVSLDYSKPCIPRLRPDDESWAQERIKSWRAAQQS
jgi:hypothetical protein